MDAEQKRFLKSFTLHSSRLLFYSNDFSRKGAVGLNNRAETALYKLDERVIADPDKYSPILLELMRDEDPRKRKAAAETCLRAFIHEEEAISVLKALKEVEGISFGTLFFIAGSLGMYRREKQKRDSNNS